MSRTALAPIQSFKDTVVRPARLAAEARAAISSFGAAEWVELVAFSTGAAAVGTVNSKVLGVRNLGRRAIAAAKSAHARVGDVGLKEAMVSAPRQTAGMTDAVLSKARAGFDTFRELDAQSRKDALVDVLVAGVTAYVVAGGGDLEGGLPVCAATRPHSAGSGCRVRRVHRRS